MSKAIFTSRLHISTISLLAMACLVAAVRAIDEDETDRLFHEGADHELQNHSNHEPSAATATKEPATDQIIPKDKILLSKVKSLTFIRNKRTTSRRTLPIHQLSCVGGTAGCKLFTPNLVECFNDSKEYRDKPIWKCRADMSDRVKFNHVDVICEGYDYPEDDYILVGSCGLEFTLDYVDPLDYHDQSYFKHMDEQEKAMHHERVGSESKSDFLASTFHWLYTLIIDRSIFLFVGLVFISIVTLVRYKFNSGPSSNAMANNPKGKKKQQLYGGSYGPLTSAMTTKKAC